MSPSPVDPIEVQGTVIQSGYKDWRGCPPHLFGANVGRPLNLWAFDEVYQSSGVVIIRDDLFEGTPGVPYSFKTHNPGQVLATWTLSQLAGQSINVTRTPYNAIMNGVMLGASGHGTLIDGEQVRYPTWRVRAFNRLRTTGALVGRTYAGSNVGATGAGLNSSIVTPYGNPAAYFMNVEVNINIPGAIFADLNFQLEVGFGSAANALATAQTLTATPEWPAYTQTINQTDV